MFTVVLSLYFYYSLALSRSSILVQQGSIISEALFQVKTEEILIGEVTYKIRGLSNMQQFSDPNDAALKLGISSAQWPLFGKVWPMGNVLARVMLTEPLCEMRVLEVGCGLAFTQYGCANTRRGHDSK